VVVFVELTLLYIMFPTLTFDDFIDLGCLGSSMDIKYLTGRRENF
jgi:hypothetical protein